MSADLSDWERRHKDSLGVSELGHCLHCAASRLFGVPKTRPYTDRQKQRMSIGQHFQDLERQALKGNGADFFSGQDIVIPGPWPFRILGRPDFVVRRNGLTEVREVKYCSFPPPEPTREWRYQLGAYQMRYGAHGVFVVYDLESQTEFRQDVIPSDLSEILMEWTVILAGIRDGKYRIEDVPHEPHWCQRSEWACPDCIGSRQATFLQPIESRRLCDFLKLWEKFQLLRQADKEFEAAKEAAQEILAAHGGQQIVIDNYELSLRVSSSDSVDLKAISPEVRATLPIKPVTRRQVIVRKGGDK